jgi:hypothetical protein
MVFNYDDAVSDKIADGCGLFQTIVTVSKSRNQKRRPFIIVHRSFVICHRPEIAQRSLGIDRLLRPAMTNDK